MTTLRRLRKRVRGLARSEAGFALPTALFATVASFALASAALFASVGVQQGSANDSSRKLAIAAGNAGANVALFRLNKMQDQLTSQNPCLAVVGGVLTPTTASADGWCPALTGTVGNASYSTRMTPWTAPGPLGGSETIVSTGTSGSVGRRVAVNLNATNVGSILAGEGLIGQGQITISNGADVRTSVGTNGSVSVGGGGNVCGNTRHGGGESTTFDNNSTQCAGFVNTTGNINLPTVTPPTDIATNNSDSRLVKCTAPQTPLGCEQDTYTKSRTSTTPWNPATRVISTDNNASLTFGGGDYWLCRLITGTNNHIYMAAGAHVRLYFDTPENCGLSNGDRQIDIGNNSDVTATAYNPALGNYDMVGLYLLGSTSIQTTAFFANNSTNEFLIYAPNTDIIVKNNSASSNATFKGPIVGKTIDIENNATLTQDQGYVPPLIGGTTVYQRTRYVECTGATGSPPDASC
jgi:hypothetical protein